MRSGAVAAAGLIVLAAAGIGAAGEPQQATIRIAKAEPDRRVEVTAAFAWAGGGSLGSQQATLTPNQAGTARYVLFTAATDLARAKGVDLRIGYRFSPAIAIEAALWYATSEVRVAISGDQEGAPAAEFSGERIKQLQFGAHLVFAPRRLRFARERIQPYASFGGGLVRQLHEGNTLSESASVIEAGAGLKIGLGPSKPGSSRRFGLRVDLRAARVQGGYHIDKAGRTYPSGMLGFYLTM